MRGMNLTFNVNKQYALKLEKYCVECLTLNENDINALFILLYLTIDLQENIDTLHITPKFKPEDLAAWAKEIDNYKGYLAWVEIYIHRKDIKFATEVLRELIQFYSDSPEAYMKLWTIMKGEDPHDALDVAEEMFLCSTNFFTLEIKIVIDLTYAEALFNSHQYIQCFEFLQNEFSKFPVYTIFLFFYGKYIILSQEVSYYGSGIGALQECLRVCITDSEPDSKSTAKPKIVKSQSKFKTHNPTLYTNSNYYLGLYYKHLGRVGKAYGYFMKAKLGFKAQDVEKSTFIDGYLSNHRDFIKVIESTKKALKNFENSHSIYSLPETSILTALKDQVIDPITVGILRSDVYSKIYRDKVKACKELKMLMKEYPDNEEAYMKYWVLMKELNNTKELEEVSNKLQIVCADCSVPSSSWAEAVFKHSEMLVQKGDIENALRTLKKICFILPPMPLSRLNYIDKAVKIDDDVLEGLKEVACVPNDPDGDALFDNSLFGDENMFEGEKSFKLENKQQSMNDSELLDLKILNIKQDDDPNNRVSLMSDMEGFNFGTATGDKSLVIAKHMSTPDERPNIVPRINIGKIQSKASDDNDSRLQSMYTNEQRMTKEEDKANSSDFDIHNISMTRPIYSGRQYDPSSVLDHKTSKGTDSRVSRSSLPRLSYAFGKKSYKSGSNTYRSRRNDTEVMSETQIGNFMHDSEGFSVYSDLKFLYQIGKICAESGKFLEEGILCLDDYINLINYLNPTESQQGGKVYQMKTKAIYLVGLIFYQNNDYDQAEKFLNQVRMDLKEIKEREKFDKCEHMLAEIFQSKFDIYSSEDVIDDYFYGEYAAKAKVIDEFDFF